ncbi:MULTISPECIES: hypothetical protein [Bacillus subtilis group]|uniref:hypothetical protein n=1 Tax=Bacillus TaxID=1386 RepID=UPI0011A38303|nr:MULTISPECIES: hypothetical protein [Bacillus subtilis group]MBT3123220.1 hypothetical protein [Bacillus inaquosorum]MCB5337320.1 Chromosome partition protein Smc [Bacillus amyloliquefaciens]QWK35292.1 hypothetical protein KM843_20515 [Bacillus velezensis]
MEGKKYLNDNEPIWLITENLNVKQEIEDGLNREVVLLRTLSDLVENVELATRGDRVVANLIYTNTMMTEIKANLRKVVELINVLTDVTVFEVGTDKTFDGAIRFSTVKKMLLFAKEARRESQISQLEDSDPKTELIEGLQIDLSAAKQQLEKVNTELKETREELKAALDECTDLKTQINNVYEVDLKLKTDLVSQLEERLADLESSLRVEKEKSEVYRVEKDDALNELTNLRFDITALEKRLDDRKKEKKILEGTISRLERQINQVNKEKEEILRSRVDEEAYVTISNELDKERKNLNSVKALLQQEKINSSTKDLTIKELQEEIDELRSGADILKSAGRSNYLDKYKFASTDLVYIKVFIELPYHRLAVKMLFDKLAERVDGVSHLIILRNDEGLDNKYFDGVPIFGKIKDAQVQNRIFRLYPNRAMFTGADSWSKKVKRLVVLDYIKSDQYYLESHAKERYMTVVDRASKIAQYGLRGAPISLDAESVFDIRFDRHIAESHVKQNRRGILEKKIESWIKKADL